MPTIITKLANPKPWGPGAYWGAPDFERMTPTERAELQERQKASQKDAAEAWQRFVQSKPAATTKGKPATTAKAQQHGGPCSYWSRK